MSITVEVDDELLRAVEEATNIHNPAELVRAALAAFGKLPPLKAGNGAGIEQTLASLPPPTKEEDDFWEDFERDREWERGSMPTAGRAALAELLACAGALPDLAEEEFTAWERELAHFAPVRDPWKS